MNECEKKKNIDRLPFLIFFFFFFVKRVCANKKKAFKSRNKTTKTMN